MGPLSGKERQDRHKAMLALNPVKQALKKEEKKELDKKRNIRVTLAKGGTPRPRPRPQEAAIKLEARLLCFEPGTILPIGLKTQTESLQTEIALWTATFHLEDLCVGIDSAAFIRTQSEALSILLYTGLLSSYEKALASLVQLQHAIDLTHPICQHFEALASDSSLDASHLRPLVLEHARFVGVCSALANTLTALKDQLYRWRTSGATEVTTVLRLKVQAAEKERSVVRAGAIILNPHDLSTLGVAKWVNDEIINFHVSRLNKSPDSADALFLPTGFVQLTVKDGKLIKPKLAMRYGPLKEWLPKRHRPWKRIVIPMHVGTNHWVVAHIDFQYHLVNVYDSLINSKNSQSWHTQYDSIVKALNEFAHLLMQHKSWPEPGADEWIALPSCETPQQSNNFDCGVYTILMMTHLQYGDTLNNAGVPLRYRLPCETRNLYGYRLILLEEMGV